MYRCLGAVFALVLFVGCIGAPAEQADLGADGTPTAGEPMSSPPFTATWSGEMAASGGVELPAHFQETAGVGHVLWPDVARDFVIAENATRMVVRLEWTGTGFVQLMANSPLQDGAWTEYADPGPMALSETSPLCVEITGDALVPGGWEVMLHTGVSADIAFTFNVTIEGQAEGPLADGEAWEVDLETWAEAHRTGAVAEEKATCTAEAI